jgi:hypothetical protein
MNVQAWRNRVGDAYIETNEVRNAKEILDRDEYERLTLNDLWSVREQLTAEAMTKKKR